MLKTSKLTGRAMNVPALLPAEKFSELNMDFLILPEYKDNRGLVRDKVLNM